MTREGENRKPESSKEWYRIPDGTKVRHRLEGGEGVIDGLTELASGPHRNADGRTQYRVRGVKAPNVTLIAEEDLMFLADRDGLVMILRESLGYRTYVTERLRARFGDDRLLHERGTAKNEVRHRP